MAEKEKRDDAMRDLDQQRRAVLRNNSTQRKSLARSRGARSVGGERAKYQRHESDGDRGAAGADRPLVSRGNGARAESAGANDDDSQHRQQRHGDRQMSDDDKRIERELHSDRAKERCHDHQCQRQQGRTQHAAGTGNTNLFAVSPRQEHQSDDGNRECSGAVTV